MNIGIRLHDTVPGGIRERLRAARAQGFSCAHIALSKVIDGFTMNEAETLMTDRLAAEINDALRENEMSCAVLGCYLMLADPEPESRRRTQGIYQAHLRFAGKIHAGVVGTETYAPAGIDPRSEEAYRLFLEGLRPVVQCAEETGATLAVEPVYSHIISTPEKAERMLNDLPSDRLQIILDAVNLIAPEKAGEADAVIEDAIRRLGDRVRVLHMKDFTATDGKIQASACGTGTMHYGQLLDFVRERLLPMTLENTVPENAEAARLYLEKQSEKVRSGLS